jgi:opacity protein-like surface antigen
MVPSVMFWDSNRMNGLSMNVDMDYRFAGGGTTTPYAGAGVGINHFDFDGPSGGRSRLGLNLFGGLRFPTSASQFFMEGRYTVSEFSQISLLGGVTFPIPR